MLLLSRKQSITGFDGVGVAYLACHFEPIRLISTISLKPTG